MSNGNQDPFQLDALDDLGRELRQREREHPTPSRRSHHPSMRHKRLAGGVVTALLTLASALVAFNLVDPAGASSPVSRSPREAEKAGTVRFVSTLEVTAGGSKVVRFAEEGGLDFATGDFETSLTLPRPSPRIDRRRVGGVLYIGQGINGSRLERWRALRLRGPAGSRAVIQPGGFALTDPQVILRVLESSRESPVVVGHEIIGSEPVTEYLANTTLLAFLRAQRRPISSAAHYEPVRASLRVWLDDLGRPVRVVAFLRGPSRLGQATTKITTTFSNYGKSIVVGRPQHSVPSEGRHRAGATGIGGDPIQVLERIVFSRP